MSPAIDPKEYYLLNKDAEPKIGDVIVILNRYNKKIAHRLINEFCGYYFTKGDKCQVVNFPSKRKEVLGVVIGKHKKIETNFLLNLFLDFFLLYFLIYNLFFDIKKKKEFLILRFFSKLLLRNKA